MSVGAAEMCKQCLQHGGSRETDDSGYHHPLQFITTYRRTQHSTLDIGPDIGIANLAIIRPGPPKHFDDSSVSVKSSLRIDWWTAGFRQELPF